MSRPLSPHPAVVALLGGLAFLLLQSYALARPATESLFLQAYSSQKLPMAWIALTVVAAGTVAVYNHFAARIDLWRLFLYAVAITCFVLAGLLLLLRLSVPGIAFLLYLWKDVYIVVLVEIFWSSANVLSRISAARWTYGFFCAMGSVGGITGNLGGGLLAGRLGTAQVLWLVLPVLGLAALISRVVAQLQQAHGLQAARRTRTPLLEGIEVVRKSSYLSLLLLVVAVVQVAVTLIDYRFNVLLEQTYPALDARTAVIGRVYAAIDVGSIVLQVLTGPILRAAGVAGTLLAIPTILGMIVAWGALVPRLATMLAAKVAGKCFDYSLFRAAKEILYIPLSYPEKTQGKALIDILTYRAAKGGASLLLLGLVAIHGSGLAAFLTLLLVLSWLALTVPIVERYKQRARLAG